MPTLPELGSSLPEVVLRTAIVYLFVVAAIRISGKRDVGIRWFTGPPRPLRNVIEYELRLPVS